MGYTYTLIYVVTQVTWYDRVDTTGLQSKPR